MGRNILIRIIAIGVVLLIGLGIYMGINQYMLTTYSLSNQTSHMIGLICGGFYLLGILLLAIFLKVFPKLAEKHGDSLEEENL